MKVRSNLDAKAVCPWHGYGVDHRLMYPLWMAAVEFNQQKDYHVQFVEGLRDEKRQMYLRANGTSPAKKSLHEIGRAMDIALVYQGQYQHEVDPHYTVFWKCVQRWDADYNGRPLIRWGGTWASRDGVHFEI
jgi:hypothetical protein